MERWGTIQSVQHGHPASAWPCTSTPSQLSSEQGWASGQGQGPPQWAVPKPEKVEFLL